MNKQEIKDAIATVSDGGISPYDLLLAIGNKDVVPEQIIENRNARATARDGKVSPEGYLRNAIEDLSNLNFRGKDQVMKVLHSNLGIKSLEGLGILAEDPKTQAFNLLHLTFILAPLLSGADKFFNWSADWGKYLSPTVAAQVPLPQKNLMRLVGGIEMIAGIITALNPELGGYIISAWLGLIIINILISGKHYDIALRDLGLGAAAFAMAKLASTTNPTQIA